MSAEPSQVEPAGAAKADQAWQRALAALDRDAGLSVAERARAQRAADRAELARRRAYGLRRRNAERLRRARAEANREEPK